MFTCIAIKTKVMYISKATKNLLETLEKMNQRTISQLSSFFLVIVLALAISSALSTPRLDKHYVRIVNNLDNSVLFYHCKSRDDDLGLRKLQPGENWQFSFHINFFGTTLFFCNFSYTNSSKIKFHAVFDVFSTELTQDCGGYNCIWIAKEDGLYLYNLEMKMALMEHDWERLQIYK